jgi:hypothetical protein
MTTEMLQLKERAEKARTLYRLGHITREEAVKECTPYLNEFNRKAVEIAKKYKQRPKKITFASFIR